MIAPLLTSAGMSIRPSNAGLFIWAELPGQIDAAAVAKRMLSRGYLTASGKHFAFADTYHSFMRFNVTTTDASAVDALRDCEYL